MATLRLVVVDDNDDLRFLVRRRLERDGGYAIVGEAADGSRGLEIAVQAQPDVVLLDLVLGLEDGAELVGPLMRACPRTMIAVLSALAPDAQEGRLRALGAFSYYPKEESDSLPTWIREDHATFQRAIAGEDVVAPSALTRPRRPEAGAPR
jgi:DNA-binding NarL/FixJ family response regulator